MRPRQRWQYGDPVPAQVFFPPKYPIPAFYFGPLPQGRPVPAVHYMVHNPDKAPRA